MHVFLNFFLCLTIENLSQSLLAALLGVRLFLYLSLCFHVFFCSVCHLDIILHQILRENVAHQLLRVYLSAFV